MTSQDAGLASVGASKKGVGHLALTVLYGSVRERSGKSVKPIVAQLRSQTDFACSSNSSSEQLCVSVQPLSGQTPGNAFLICAPSGPPLHNEG